MVRMRQQLLDTKEEFRQTDARIPTFTKNGEKRKKNDEKKNIGCNVREN